MTVPPLRREVLVPCEPGLAYRVFLDEIGTWWPVATHGCFGPGATVALEGARIVETAADGRTAVWGTLVEARAPHEVAFTWHPGRDPEEATRVSVRFARTGDHETLVTLVHTGWETRPDAVTARDSYATGWVTVLGRYAAASSLRSRRQSP